MPTNLPPIAVVARENYWTTEDGTEYRRDGITITIDYDRRGRILGAIRIEHNRILEGLVMADIEKKKKIIGWMKS